MIKGKDKKHLENIISELHRLGAQLPEAEDVVVATAPKDKVVPKGFYATTNHATYVKIAGEWKPVLQQKMDAIIVVRDGIAHCVTLGHIKKGDKVVVGKHGVRIVPPERPRGHTIFEFMGGQVSSERPSQSLIKQIAEEILEVKAAGGKLVIVGGPAIIHTGGQQALAEMVRNGYVDGLLAGNAPHYRCYPCADGQYVAVGALEPAFFAALWRGLDLGDTPPDNADRANWPAIERAFAHAFLTRSRNDWATHFAGTDACVTPVLAPGEVWTEPQIAHRHPAAGARAVPPVPRLSRTPGIAQAADPSDQTHAILAEAGLTPDEIAAAMPDEAAERPTHII
jgi:hypothetical protein